MDKQQYAKVLLVFSHLTNVFSVMRLSLEGVEMMKTPKFQLPSKKERKERELTEVLLCSRLCRGTLLLIAMLPWPLTVCLELRTRRVRLNVVLNSKYVCLFTTLSINPESRLCDVLVKACS